MFLIQLLLQLLHALKLVNSLVSCASLFRNLSFKVDLHLFFFVFLSCSDDLASGDLFLDFFNLVLCDDELAIRLALMLLQLVDMILKLHNHLSQLIVLLTELVLESLKPQLIDLLALYLNLLQFVVSNLVSIIHLQRPQLDLYIAQVMLRLPCPSLLLQQ